jgi:DUF1365 family protein
MELGREESFANIVIAKVWHQRFAIKKNFFTYKVFYLLIDLSSKEQNKLRSFSVNKFNFFSFYSKEYGKSKISTPDLCQKHVKNNTNNHKNLEELYLWGQNVIKEAGCLNFEGKIKILTHPKILGFGFNPVNFWFFFNKDGLIIAIIAEVNNTFKENHCYLIKNNDWKPLKQQQTFICNKDFFVSPFFERKGEYIFNFAIKNNKINIKIDYLQNKILSLSTGISGKMQDISDFKLFKATIFSLMVVSKVLILIHWQAIKLILKKINYFKKPTIQSHKLTSAIMITKKTK